MLYGVVLLYCLGNHFKKRLCIKPTQLMQFFLLTYFSSVEMKCKHMGATIFSGLFKDMSHMSVTYS